MLLGWTHPAPPTPHLPAPNSQKAESEELETQKPQVKLRRTVSEVVRPASTPPIIASAIKDDDDEDRIIAELEVSAGGAAGCPSSPAPVAMPPLPCLLPAPGIFGERLGVGPGNDIPSTGTAMGSSPVPDRSTVPREGQHRAAAPASPELAPVAVCLVHHRSPAALPPHLGL